MAISKVIFNGTTLMDVTGDTVDTTNLLTGYTATKNNGNSITGTYSAPSVQSSKSYSVSASGSQTISPDSGYDAMEEVSLTVPSGSATTPTTTITANPAISVDSSGLITATTSASQSITPTVSAGYVSSGTSGTVTVSGSNTNQLTTQAAQTITPTTSNQTIASGTYLTGTQTIAGDANLVASNIVSGVSIFGVAGSASTGGGSSWTLLASQDFSVSTTSTSASSVGTIAIGSSAYTSSSIIYVKVRDKAGGRSGYFTGSDSFFINPYPNNSATTTLTAAGRLITRCSGQGVSGLTYAVYAAGTTTGYGVYGYSINSSGTVTIYRRYNSSYSLTINGTYNVEVYALDYATNTGNPYNFSF